MTMHGTALATEPVTVDEELLQNLPAPRSLGVLRAVPGVYGRVDTVSGAPGSLSPSARGEGREGNHVFVDGFSVRDPATKTVGIGTLPHDAIESIRVWTGGAPAEIGQFTGMAVEVDTRDGGDEHHGSLGAWLESHASAADYVGFRIIPEPRFARHEVAGTLGGPIVREKLWYFAAVQGVARRSWFSADTGPELRSRDYDVLAKLTWFVTPDVTLRYRAVGGRTTTENTAPAPRVHSSAVTDRLVSYLGHLVSGSWRPDARRELEWRAGWQPSRIDVVPSSGDPEEPLIYDAERDLVTNNAGAFDRNRRLLAGGNLSFAQVAGEHRLEAGVGWLRAVDSRDLDHTGAGGPFDGIRYVADAQHPCETDADGDGILDDCASFEGFHEAGERRHSANLGAIYLQDDWTHERVSAHLGFRVDHEAMFQDTGELVWGTWTPAPRLGFALDLLGDDTTRLVAHYGWYADTHGSLLGRWGDTRREVREQYVHTGEDYELVSDPTVTPLHFCTDDGLREVAEADRAKARAVCGRGFRGYHAERAVLGLEREIVPSLSVGVKGLLSRTVGLPDDYNVTSETWVISNRPPKRRDYRALEVTVTRLADERGGLIAAWTLSSSTGHAPGQFEGHSHGNGVGVYGDGIGDPETRASLYDEGLGSVVDGLDGLGTYRHDRGHHGPLPYDARHVVKVQGFRTFGSGTTLGVVYELDSGRAWEKRGFTPLYQDWYGFPEGRGSRRMPAIHYVDVRVAQAIRFAGQEVEVSLDLFNLPDFDTATAYLGHEGSDFGRTLHRQAPRSVRAGLRSSF